MPTQPFFPDPALARDVAARFQTPAYVYDEVTLATLAADVTGFAAPYGLDARFAMKANPSRAVLRIFRSKGLGFDASTVFEAQRAIASGAEPHQVQITAQMLSEGFEDLFRRGVRVTCCSLAQIERAGRAFAALGADRASHGEIGLRINPGEGSGANNRTQVAGRDASFGLWWEQIEDAKLIAASHGLRITWAHHHVGSGGDPAKWAAIAARTLEFVEGLPDVTRVNLGGGFKVARMPGEKQTDLRDAARETSALLTAFAERTGRRLQLEIEPGTYLVANAGAIVARVVDVVTTGASGHTFVKVDAGMAEIIRPAMYGAQHPIAFYAADGARPLGPTVPVLVVGPCCESGDLLTPAAGDPEALGHRMLPLPSIGDLCVIGGAGAYCASMAAKNYNSIPTAPEIVRGADGSLTVVRRRQTLDDVLREETV